MNGVRVVNEQVAKQFESHTARLNQVIAKALAESLAVQNALAELLDAGAKEIYMNHDVVVLQGKLKNPGR